MANFWQSLVGVVANNSAVTDSSDATDVSDLFDENTTDDADGFSAPKEVNGEKPYGILIAAGYSEQWVKYSAGRVYIGNEEYTSIVPNTFLYTALTGLNRIRNTSNGGKIIDSLVANSKFAVFLVELNTGTFFQTFNNKKGGYIPFSGIIESTRGVGNFSDAFAHELFHAYHKSLGYKKASLNVELAGYLVGYSIARRIDVNYVIRPDRFYATGNSEADIQFLENFESLLSAPSFDRELFVQTVKLWEKCSGPAIELYRDRLRFKATNADLSEVLNNLTYPL